MRVRLRPFLKQRLLLCAAIASLGVGLNLTAARFEPADVSGLARLLGASAGVAVEPGEVSWEPSRGVIFDSLLGRRVLFLGREAEASNRDLFRARVQVSYEGKLLGVESVHNLTQTPLGDELGLQARGAQAVYATVAFGELQGITLLGLAGFSKGDTRGSVFNRLLLGLRALQEGGAWAGLQRTHLSLLEAERVSFQLEDQGLRLSLGGERTYTLNSDTLELTPPGDDVVIASQHFGSELWLHSAVELVRHETGPEFVAWLEQHVFGVSDSVRRSVYSLVRESQPLRADAQRPPAKALTSTASWPPKVITSRFATAADGEGEWRPVAVPGDEARLNSELFYRTFVRPDADRPYARLQLMAFDMRRLQLGMEAGFEEPRPTTGPPGRGALPDDPKLLRRVVATFNGAFKSTHGDYGMMVERRVLVPPRAGAATVAVTEAGEVGLGTWQGERIADHFVSFRQNLEPLVANSQINPAGRKAWGQQVLGQRTLTERSALCRTSDGQLMYAWGRDLTGKTLAAGLKQAGCDYAMHLDMNPGHCGFVLLNFPEGQKAEFKAQLGFAGMDLNPSKFVRWSDQDFFYLYRRSSLPVHRGINWHSSLGLQPEPSHLPAFYEGDQRLGALSIRMFSVEPGRVRFKIVAGSDEPMIEGRPAPRRALEAGDQPLFALGLGYTTLPTRLGLAFGLADTIALRSAYATVTISSEGDLRVLKAGVRAELESGTSAVQLPQLAVDGELTVRARQRGEHRARGALCVDSFGHLLVATSEHDSSGPLAMALVKLGCRLVVETDRASKHAAFLHRAGTNNSPRSAYNTTVLYGLARASRPRTFGF